ncbi:MAG: TetR family transcriptional regulator [Cellulomonas sp.]|nr:TetR family transcriptional regulator [Cellulomonas sp.]
MTRRSDAVRNRARLVDAATEVFHEVGAAAPLDLVAVRAGVGRGTLYRHFPDRAALVVAVYARQVDLLDELAARTPPTDLLPTLIRTIARNQVELPGLHTVVRGAQDGTRLLDDVERRTRTLLTAAVAAARDHHRLAPDVGVDDLLLLIAMVEGVIATASADQAPERVARAVELTLRGLGCAPPRPMTVDPDQVSPQAAALAQATAALVAYDLPAETVLDGSPRASLLELGTVDGTPFGLWALTEGTVTDVEQDEVFVVLAGRGTLTVEDPAATVALEPGMVCRLQAGARTNWNVSEPIRKLYMSGRYGPPED